MPARKEPGAVAADRPPRPAPALPLWSAPPSTAARPAARGRALVRWARQVRRWSYALAYLHAHRDLPYTQAIPTPLGDRRRALLGRLGAELGDVASAAGAWSPPEVQVDPPGFVFAHADGRRLAVELYRPGEARAFARTEAFAIRYQGARALGADEPFVRAVVAALARGEAALRGAEGFPGLLLDRGATQVLLYPQDQRVELRPTLACNHHCGFCNSVDRSIENVTQGLGDLRAGIPAWADLPIRRATVTGGEPTLLRDLPDLLADLADRGLRVELQTNGMALADDAYARRLRDAGVHTVLVSLHASDAARSDGAVTGFAGAWARTVAGIDNALRHGLAVEISHVVHRANDGDTPAFLALVRARWGRRVRVRLAFVAPTGGAAAEPARFLPALPAALPAMRAALAFARAHRLRVVVVAYCGVPPCLLRPHEAFAEVTRRAATRYPERHVKFAACRACVYDAACPGLWEGYVAAHGDPGVAAITRAPRLPRALRALLDLWLG